MLDSGAEGPWVQIAAATLSGNSLMQTVHTHRASVYQAANLVGLGQLGVANSAPPTRRRDNSATGQLTAGDSAPRHFGAASVTAT